MAAYEKTGIWKRAFASTTEPDEAAERLRAAYARFWTNAIALAQQIQKTLPGLTLHDENHFQALWERADQIAGPDYILTPLEAFVLGGAILLHDGANATAAYRGGLDEVKATPEYQDALAEWRGAGPDADRTPSTFEEGAILLQTLRSIHAERAETLASFQIEAAGRTFYLIEDGSLRGHMGPIIGLVAASHHWDLDTLAARLPAFVGALGDMPTDWRVRPVVLACLLRCADATQLDQARAPDFLFGILGLKGVSEKHWRAQNRLAKPIVDKADPHALRFTSTFPFGPDDAEAWWIAHDAIAVANTELRSCDSLLRDLKLPPFAVSRVHGAETPGRLARDVLVTGWRPVAAQVRATRIERIVDMFGGEQLYGRDGSIVVRELIQNAADAVRFRRELEPADSDYQGTIIVRLRCDPVDAAIHLLSVEDDGIGMSEAVLTGPLIDFGASYVSSALVKTERPGLLSKGRKRTGEYGVGFFSAFMVTDDVSVTSKPFEAGLDQSRTLRFSNGIATRPLLLDTRPDDFSARASTRVTLRLTQERLADVLTTRRGLSGNGTALSLPGLVAALCPLLDVDVDVDADGARSRAHRRRWMEGNRLAWLRGLIIADPEHAERREVELAQAVPLLRPIDEADPSAGLAAITGVGGLGVASVGGLRATPSFGNQQRDDFVGSIDFVSAGPARHEGRARAANMLPDWATEQARLVAAAGIDFPQRQWAAQKVATFGGDATPIAGLLLNRNWTGMDGVLDFLSTGKILYAPLKAAFQRDEHVLMTIVRERHSGFIDNYQPGELEYVVDVIEAPDNSGGDDLFRVPTTADPAPCGICSLLTNLAATRGFMIEGEILQTLNFARYVGVASPRQRLEPGKMVATSALKLSARPAR